MRFRTRTDAARHAARARWRAAEARAEAERAAGIPDRPAPVDLRQPINLDLTSYGGQRLRADDPRAAQRGPWFDSTAGHLYPKPAPAIEQ